MTELKRNASLRAGAARYVTRTFELGGVRLTEDGRTCQTCAIDPCHPAWQAGGELTGAIDCLAVLLRRNWYHCSIKGAAQSVNCAAHSHSARIEPHAIHIAPLPI